MSARPKITVVLAALFVLSVASFAPPADARELSMREARQAIDAGRAVSFAAALSQARRSVPGDVLRAAMVERPSGSLIFRFKILTSGGAVKIVIIDGRNGSVLSIR